MDLKSYILDCDGIFENRLMSIAETLSVGEAKLISLSGPTCSGKTTAAAMLEKNLETYGGEVHTVSIDDFYYGRDYLHTLSAEKGNGDIDYDSENTIDLEALEGFVCEVMSGKEAHCPIFDFSSGSRTGYRTYRADKNDVFIFEGIQAIYPKIKAILEPYGTVSVYIAPLTSVTAGGQTFLPNEIRLMRRLVRDSNFRGADALFTLKLWQSVRLNEEVNIFPYVGTCKYKINSTHDYEIGVLKPYLEKILSPVLDCEDFGTAAEEILLKIKDVADIDSALIPKNSMYREFV